MLARTGTSLMGAILGTAIATGIATAATGPAEAPASNVRKTDAEIIFADDFESWEAQGTRPHVFKYIQYTPRKGS